MLRVDLIWNQLCLQSGSSRKHNSNFLKVMWKHFKKRKKAENFVLFSKHTEDWSLGDSLSSNSEGHFPKKLVRSQDKQELLQHKPSSQDGQQNGRGVGACGVLLSSCLHQEYMFWCRRSHKTPFENWQESLTIGKKYIDPHKTHVQGSLGALAIEVLLSPLVLGFCLLCFEACEVLVPQ